MMTTDTVPKTAVQRAGPARVVGVAKGVGMIEPDMATMLAFVLTDAEVDAADPRPAVAAGRRRHLQLPERRHRHLDLRHRRGARQRGGRAGERGRRWRVALREVCLDLTLQLARDGEGATKLLTVTVRSAARRDTRPGGWPRRSSTRRWSRPPCTAPTPTGAGSPWPSANARTTPTSTPSKVVIRFGDLEAYPARPGAGGAGAELSRIMAADHVEIEVELGIGTAEATVYGCDLSAGYVRINADYTT